MFSKTLLLFAIVLVRVSLIRTEDDIATSPDLEPIQNGIFRQLLLYLQTSWNDTAANRQNVYFFPTLMRIRRSTTLMKSFHLNNLVLYFPQDSYLKYVYELARIRDSLENSSKIDVKFKMALFYDSRYMSKLYLDDLKLHYHPETFDIIPFMQYSKRSLTQLIDDWKRNNTKEGGVRKIVNYRWSQTDNHHHVNIFSFTGCWDMPKNITKSIEKDQRSQHFIPAKPTLVKFNIALMSEVVDIQAFSARNRVGYFDNSEKHYQAIKLPFINTDFAMAVVLPYENHTTEIFATFKDADFQQLFRHLKENYENINYTIPVIDSPEFLINEKGVSINGGDLCQSSLESEIFTNEVTFKQFLVSRPFGIIIYHEPKSLILMYGLMRNLATNSWLSPRFRVTLHTLFENDLSIEYLGN